MAGRPEELWTYSRGDKSMVYEFSIENLLLTVVCSVESNLTFRVCSDAA